MKIELYKDRKGEWRWRMRARNGRVIATSGEGYKRAGGARRAMIRLTQELRLVYSWNVARGREWMSVRA